MKPEPEAELQATANLSPISPSPVHSVAPQVVPALQDRVDTLDAMVAAAAAVAANASASNDLDLDPLVGAGDDDVVDDDSLNDPYGEVDQDSSAQPQQPPQEEQELPDINDDYAKTFDSPIGLEEVEGGDIQPEDVSSMPRESNQVSLSSEHLTSHPSETSYAAPKSPSTSAQQAQSGASALTAALPEAHPDESTTSAEHPPNPDPAGFQSVTSPSTASADSNSAGSPNPSADIQRLVADLTAPAEPTASDDPSALSAKAELPAGASSVLPSSASLPPRPPLPQAASQSYTSQHHPSASSSSIPASVAVPPTPGQPSTYVAAGAPGLSPDALGNLPPVAATGLNASVAITSMTAPPYPPHSPAYATDRPQDADYQRQWDQFMADERQYMSEAKWDRFPEGSRLFIGTRSASGASKNGAHIFSTGNLSSDKVSKRDVFDLFHRFGRLAQISLKSAYGFVQYHTLDEGHAALENLQGIEIKGRRIHLEISRVQDKSKKERNRSPERGRGRDGGGRESSGRDGSGREGGGRDGSGRDGSGRDGSGRDGGRRNDRSNHQNRDDYRPGRSTHSPRRNDYQREEGYGRDRGFNDGGRGRGRSRSPSGYARNDKESYRRRSPSPYGRPRHEAEIDLPRRYGADVPDVQIILQPDVNRDFVNWVEQTFKTKGLKSEVMFLHPRIPKDAVIQRQAAEGVHAVVDLDLRAQSLGRIPVQAFDRSAGLSNVRFDQYVDLDPPTAAEVILRAKASGATAAYSQPYGAAGYANPYAGQPQQLGVFPGGQPANQYAQHIPANAADVAGLIGQVDNTTLQQLLASIQTSGQSATAQHMSNAGVAGASQVDIQAILGSLGGNAAPQQQAAVQGAYGAAYGAQPAPNGGAANGDSAVQVQNIMAQLARWRQ